MLSQAVFGSSSQLKAVFDTGVNLNRSDDFGHTPLWYAVQKDFNRENVQIMLDAGADINLTNNNGSNVLYLACTHARFSSDHVVAILRKGPNDSIVKFALKRVQSGYNALRVGMQSCPHGECAHPSTTMPLLQKYAADEPYACEHVGCYNSATFPGEGNTSMKMCSCRTVCYCCRDHQLQDWKNHKKICPGPQDTTNSSTTALNVKQKSGKRKKGRK